MARTKATPATQWARVDLHIHSPASADYQDKSAGFIDLLRKAEERELDAIAITDHNSVAGIAGFRRRLETLSFLEQENRLSPEETAELDEYHRILNRVLVLPGFELTATLGFHILAIFPAVASIRKLEHVLLELNVPEEKLDEGTGQIGATTDVLTAYGIMNRAGALVVAAHANSTHGVAMQGFNFGGQTKISYTQDPNLHALEVTDLENTTGRRRSTANFFNGSKPEYPRRMHCIQGSDAHRLDRSEDGKSLGIGDRPTEMLLPEVSFDAIKELLQGEDFARTRPYRAADPIDPIKQALEEGPTLVQSFHDRATTRNRGYDLILHDVAAFANTNGGTVFIGAGPGKNTIKGVEKPQEIQDELLKEIAANITPPLQVEFDTITANGKGVLVLQAPKGTETPYVLNPGQVWVREESETAIAARDEIVRLVLQTLAGNRPPVAVHEPSPEQVSSNGAGGVEPPRTGVEIVDSEDREGIRYHTVRDLRNGGVVQNVTRFSARRLWRYAITERELQQVDLSKVQWQGDLGLWKTYKRGGETRYNLVQRDPDGNLHVYYGVTEEGLHGPWLQFAVPQDAAEADQPSEAEEPVPVG